MSPVAEFRDTAICILTNCCYYSCRIKKRVRIIPNVFSHNQRLLVFVLHLFVLLEQSAQMIFYLPAETLPIKFNKPRLLPGHVVAVLIVVVSFGNNFSPIEIVCVRTCVRIDRIDCVIDFVEKLVGVVGGIGVFKHAFFLHSLLDLLIAVLVVFVVKVLAQVLVEHQLGRQFDFVKKLIAILLNLFLVLQLVAALDFHEYQRAQYDVADHQTHQADLTKCKFEANFHIALKLLGVNIDVFVYSNYVIISIFYIE